MATLIPSLGSCKPRMTGGERRFAERLESHLEDDYLCWYDVPIGPHQRHPDFVVLHPRRGFLILEVKDWRLETILEASRTAFTLRTERGPKHVENPLAQARDYAFAVKEVLERDPALVEPTGHAYEGRLICPYGYGVVLTRITRNTFESSGLDQVIDGKRVICQDEMTDSGGIEDFQTRLWSMFFHRSSRPLTLPEIDRIRGHLFPEIRIDQGELPIAQQGQAKSPTDSVPDLIRVMDLQQERLARSLGEGHRVVHGVAGSGKTMILGYRCARLAGLLNKPILVLCYNVALASKLDHVIRQRDLDGKVAVRHFHGWCQDQIRLYGVAKPEPGDRYVERLVEAVIRAVEREQVPRGQYGAVLLDEGHDFESDWLKLVVQMVDPETNSLLVLYDDAQSIYAKRAHRKFSFASVGIQAQGRTTILKLNYRNTEEVLAVAYEFAREELTPEGADDDGVPIVEPTTAGRHGPPPELVKLPSLKSEASFLAQRLRELHERGRAWNEMAVVYRSSFVGEEVTKTLRESSVPIEWLQETKQNRRFRPDENSVKVLTMHSSKGLEFPVVAIPGLGFMPYAEFDAREEARLLYVAMTRAMDHLILTHHRDSEFAQRLGSACLKRAA